MAFLRIVSLAAIGAFCAGLPLAGPSARTASARAVDPKCAFVDRSNPKASRGNLDSPDYKFTHTSDVEAGTGQLNHVTQVLQNDHPTAILPADWVKAEVVFQRIRVGGCGKSEVDTPLEYRLDPGAVVRYDPTLKLMKTAPAYARAAAQSTVRPPSMTSRLFVQLDGSTVDLIFTSAVEGGDYRYGLQNAGSGAVSVTVAALSQRWAALNVQPASDWPRAGGAVANAFRLPAGPQPVVMRFQASAGAQAVADIVQLRVIDPDRPAQPLAAGPVSVYLPQAR
jgi:hypothetical protein